MNANNALWEKGDNMRIMDFGIGTTALPAARLGANVLGIDIGRNLADAGNTRAQDKNIANGLFQKGNASDLSKHADDTFDLVLSIFGAAMIW